MSTVQVDEKYLSNIEHRLDEVEEFASNVAELLHHRVHGNDAMYECTYGSCVKAKELGL